ncbi:uncharacterized protein LOC113646932 isoform X2 [Tachysurus fulvidraco]|uniref:uncharacterized protein LOC113646932 isoform X2 n=1 Tax=Tachysurus fulvidraco TaxID=1234273 RepID=UPI001FEFF5C6|nr:uncharacterized protein LOC113646932 isoform X2 [Tachysurus fulvidraco]
MIRLVVALCALFSLFTAVKTSDIKEIDVITVKRGEDVTMKCSISSVTKRDVVWYRQISGKLPQHFAKPYNLGYKFSDGFNDARFSISVNNNKFDLNIKKTREDDEGEYFCGEMEGSVVKFTSGTRLQFEDTTHRPTSGTTHRDSSISTETYEVTTHSNTPGTTHRDSSNSTETCESCTANMCVFFWLSITRSGVLSVTVIITTICPSGSVSHRCIMLDSF